MTYPILKAYLKLFRYIQKRWIQQQRVQLSIEKDILEYLNKFDRQTIEYYHHYDGT